MSAREKVCRFLPAMLLGLTGLAGAANAADPSAAGLAKAELAFAQTSAEKGMKEAFVAFLADDAILFRPDPVAGRAWMRSHPEPPVLLTWRPAYAQVARAGDLGFTSGPAEIRSKDPKATEVEYATFVTVWKRQADGEWKVLVDLGTSSPKPAESLGSVTAELGAVQPGTGEVDTAAERARLLALDQALSTAAAAQGAAAAYHGHLAPKVRLLRHDAALARGPEAAEEELRRHPGTLTWKAAEGGVSRSGDLGYTYGVAELDGPARERSAFLRIWERQPGGEWQVVVDLLHAIPTTPPPRKP